MKLSVEVSVVGAQAVLVNWTLDTGRALIGRDRSRDPILASDWLILATDQRSGHKGDKGENMGHQVQLEIVYSPVQAR